MLIFALGAVVEGRIRIVDEELQGLDYFTKGNQMIDGMSLLTRSLIILQYQVIQASFY